MTSSLLLCLTALLAIYSTAHAAGNINCRKFVYHPKCRGVAAKRSDLSTLASHRRPDVDRKSDDELMMIDPEYLPVDDILQPLQNLQPLPRHSPGPALWNYLADRPANLLPARRKPDLDTLELAYDYE